jgi:tRNA(fMet)-specific endonuclease VapC
LLTRSAFGRLIELALIAVLAREPVAHDPSRYRSLVNRARRVHDQVEPYERLAKLIDFLSDWHLFPFNVVAADAFERLRKQRVRVGSQDLKIAATAIVHDALLLKANLRDFRQMPGLKAEDWLHP